MRLIWAAGESPVKNRAVDGPPQHPSQKAVAHSTPHPMHLDSALIKWSTVISLCWMEWEGTKGSFALVVVEKALNRVSGVREKFANVAVERFHACSWVQGTGQGSPPAKRRRDCEVAEDCDARNPYGTPVGLVTRSLEFPGKCSLRQIGGRSQWPYFALAAMASLTTWFAASRPA